MHSPSHTQFPAPRHGMQTLGKVVRRNPTPAAGLSAASADITSEANSSASNTNSSDPKGSGSDDISSSLSSSNTVPGTLTGSSHSSSSASGWAAVPSADAPATQTTGQDASSCLSKPASGSRQPSAPSGPAPQSTPWTAAQTAATAATSSGPALEHKFPDQIRGKTTLLPAQEFPELGVEEVPAVRQPDVKQQQPDPGPYGPGPSLRPAIGSNWSQGSVNVPGSGPGGTGGGVNCSQASQNPSTGSQGFSGPALTGNGAGGGYRSASGPSVQRNAYPGAGGSSLSSGSGQDFRSNR